MVLGVVGPLLVLFHANFHLGATNSNVALICMLLVAGSGVVGRYIYTRLHAHLDGTEDTLEQLQGGGRAAALADHDDLRSCPVCWTRIDRVEERLDCASGGDLGRLPAPVHRRSPRSAGALAVHRRDQSARGERAVAGIGADRRGHARRIAWWRAATRTGA